MVAANLAAFGLAGFGVFNVGTGVETSVVDLCARISEILGTKSVPRHADAKQGEQRRSVITAALLEKRTGARPVTPLAAGLRQTAAWFAERASRPNR